MGVRIPNPSEVDDELITAVLDGCDSDTDVEVVPTGNDRPGLLRVHEGTVHTHYGDFDVVGVAVSDDKTLVHVE